MILKHIHLINFKKYEKASITFDNSMVGIFGNNGAGKSSLFEAVTWCLYGVAQSMEGREGVKQEDLIKDGENEMGVEVEFLLGNHLYRVTRYLSAKRGIKSRLHIDGKLQARKSREVISRIEQDIGLNVKGFISSSFIRQKELDLITSKIASERKKLINRLFNLRIYEKFEEAAKNKKKEKERELDQVKTRIKEKEKLLEELPTLEKQLHGLEEVVKKLQSKYENIKTQSDTIKIQYKNLEKDYNHYIGLTSNLKIIEKDIENLENMLKERKNDLKVIEDAVTKKEELKPEYDNFLNLREQLSSLDASKSVYDTKMNQLQNLKTEITVTTKNLQERIIECEEEITELKNQKEEFKKIKPILNTIREKISELEDAVKQKEEEAQKMDKIKEKEAEILAEKAGYKSRIADLQEELEEIRSIGVGAPCPKCKRPLEKEHLEELTAKYKREITVNEKAKDKYKVKEKHLAEMRKELDSTLKTLKKKEDELTKLRKEEQEYVKAETRIEGIEKRIQDRHGKIAENNEKLKKMDEQKEVVTKLKKEIDDLKFDPSEYKRVKKEVDEKSQIEKEIIKLNERISKKEDVAKSIEKTDEKLTDQEKKTEEMNSELQKIAEIPEKFEDIKIKREQIAEKELKISKEYTEKKTQYDERIKELEKLKESKEELKKIKNEKKDIEEMIEIYTVLQNAFKQIPVQIQSRLRPRIKKETSFLLSEVTEGKYPFIDLEKDYSLTVYYDGSYYPISRFSGGEKDLINLCLRVGISQVLLSLSSQKSFARIRSLFLDECFGSFDMERRRNLLAALNQLRKYFAQIILITHIEEIKEALPEAFLVEEQGDGSSVIRKIK